MKHLKFLWLCLFTALTSPFLGATNFLQAMERLEVQSPELVVFMDLEDDFSAMGKHLSDVYNAWLLTGPDVPPVPVDFSRLFNHLGLLSLKSYTLVSETHSKAGYLNQSLLSFKETPLGLFLVFGERNKPFSIAQEAPADADFAVEFSIDGNRGFEILKAILIDMMGPIGQGLIDSQLNEPVAPDGPTLQQIIDRLETQIQVFSRMQTQPDATTPSTTLPIDNLVIKANNLGSLLQAFAPLLKKSGFIAVPGSNGTIWELSINEAPVRLLIRIGLIPSSDDLLLTVGKGTDEWYNNKTASLADNPQFSDFVVDLPTSGLGFWYNSEDFASAQARQFTQGLSDAGLGPEYLPLINHLEGLMEMILGKQAGTIFFEENALRSVSYQPASYKENAAIAGAVVIPIAILLDAAEKQLGSD
jgi:hypothetical protein